MSSTEPWLATLLLSYIQSFDPKLQIKIVFVCVIPGIQFATVTGVATPTARSRRRGHGSWPACRARGGFRAPRREHPPQEVAEACLLSHIITACGAEDNGTCDRCKAQYLERTKIYTSVRCTYQGQQLHFCER